MCDEGYLKSEDHRQAYIKPLGQAWKKVTYANVDGRGIFEGCIILGRTDAPSTSNARQVCRSMTLEAMPALAHRGAP